MDLGTIEPRKGDIMNIQIESDTALAWRLLYTLATDLPSDWKAQIGREFFLILTVRSAARWLACNPPDALPATPNQQRIVQYIRGHGTDVVLQALLEASGDDDSWGIF